MEIIHGKENGKSRKPSDNRKNGQGNGRPSRKKQGKSKKTT